jgi:hypothetical protein
MNMIKKCLYLAFGTFVLIAMTSCEATEPEKGVLFISEEEADAMIAEGHLYSINDFMHTFMDTEKGDFGDKENPYRSRSTNGNGIYLYAVDTLPSDGEPIYIRGRVTTDDYAGNFYKTLIIQQRTNWETGEEIPQQNLRISVDLGSVSGMFPMGQELLICCNGLAVGRYGNQPQLCVPAYNNNMFAMNATQKVGWAPGRIPAAKIRNCVYRIGRPDPKALKYDTLTLQQLFSEVPEVPQQTVEDMWKVREADGRLVCLKDIYFTGEANDDGKKAYCKYAHPDSSTIANVFASTTKNIGFPQGRIIKSNDDSKRMGCSNSEYSKFANYLLPGAQQSDKPVKDKPYTEAIEKCQNKEFRGSITGILSWYCDNATSKDKDGTMSKLWDLNWSVTPRGIPGVGVNDIDIIEKKYKRPWVPKEFDPKKYQEDKKNQANQ